MYSTLHFMDLQTASQLNFTKMDPTSTRGASQALTLENSSTL